MSQQQSTADEIINAIALEAQALENVFVQAKLEYHHTPAMLGKKWYSVGLESIDSDKEKDTANKQGVIRRMIDAIVAFVKRIVTYIRNFISGSGKGAEEREKGLKNYQGPTDQQLVRTANKVSKEAAAEASASKEAGAAINKAATSSRAEVATTKAAETEVALAEKAIDKEVMATAFARAEGYLGKKFTRKEAVEAFLAERIETIEKRLGQRVGMFCKSLEEEFHSAYASAMTITQKVIREEMPHLDDLGDLMSAVKRCYEIASDSSKNEDTLMKFVYGLNTAMTGRALSYAQATYSLDDMAKYIEKLQQKAESLKNESSEEAVEQLQAVQKAVSSLTAYSGLCTKLDTMHKVAYEVLIA